MPTYQYACRECGYRFEEVQAFTDPSLTECPQCHGRLRKVYGSVGVVFKGSGFYRTDSRADSGAKVSSLSPEHSATKNGDAAASKSETKAAAGATSGAGSSAASTSSSGGGSGNGKSSTAPAKAAAG